MKKKTNTLLAGLGLMLASILVFGNISTESVSAYSATITTSNSIELDITPNGDGTSIHSESINVQSDCRAGYNLTIATPEGSSLYKYSNNTQSDAASFTAVDGTSALSSSNNTNKWGYTLTSNPTSSTIFSPLSTTASILKTSSQTASPSADIDDTFNINYGAKVDNTIEAGTYKMANNGAIVYYLTMDTTCTQYTVSFNPNGGTGTMDNQGIEAGDPTKLTPSESLTAPTGGSYTDADNNTITGDPDKLWTFWGWNTEIDGTGDWYKDRELVEDLTTAGSTITLYAQWKQATLADMVVGTQVGTEKVIDHNLMQDVSAETCYNSTAYSTDTSSDAHNPYDPSTNPNGYHTITLLDYRGKVTTGENPESPESYTVSKLPDNLCWMTKDLNLGRESGGANNDGTVTLTSEDTDLVTDTTFTLPASPTTYTTGTTGYRTPQILINHTVTSYTVNSVSYSPTIGHYSWAAATATNTAISTSGDITTSICPKNWDLPTRMQFYNLRSKGSVTSAAIAHAAPYNFVYGGYRSGASSYSDQTARGYYWTSSNSSSSYGYWNYVYSSGIYNSSTSSGYKYYGSKVRCVASQGKVTINYDGNGTVEYPVTGNTASQENVIIGATNTQENGFVRNGWHFDSWNTEPDGSGIAIPANSDIAAFNFKPGTTITLYAQWLPQYTITYVNNCQTYISGNASCTQSVSDDTNKQGIDLDASGNGSGELGAYNYNSWTLTGWKIKGWSTAADNSSDANTEYPVSSTYSVTGQIAGSGITLYAHWVPVYSIQYDGNGADNPNGMGDTDEGGIKSVRQINVGEGDSVTLLPSNFIKEGYGFAGWSTDNNAWTHYIDNDNTNDPVIFGPIETITAPPYPNNATNTITMYAVWVEAEKDGNNDPIYLQDFGATECNNLSSASFNSTTGKINAGSVIALTDKRDNKIYTIAKLADGNCWMIENLRLDSAGTLGNNINDSNVTNQSLSQGYGGAAGIYGNFVGLANPESSGISDNTASNSIYKSSSEPPVDTYNPATGSLEDIGTSDSPGVRLPRYANTNLSGATLSWDYIENYYNAQSISTTGKYQTYWISSYGNKYNWHAAVANTRLAIAGDGVSPVYAGTSICPAGWMLPTTGSPLNDIGVLSQSYGGTSSNAYAGEGGEIMSNRFRSFPNNFLLSFNGTSGSYWSKTSDYVYDLSLTNLRFSGIQTTRSTGRSVRCFIQPSTVEITLDTNDSLTGINRIYGVPGNSINLPKPSKAGYKFIGWNTMVDGSGINYTTSYDIPINSTGITLYAQQRQIYNIQYDGNGADNPNGMGTIDTTTGVKSVQQINIGEGDPVTLLATNFKKAGNGFAGWSTDPDAWTHFTDNDNTNDPIIYGPMETINAPAYPTNGTNIITMYAVWVPAEKSDPSDPSSSPLYLQDFTASNCNALTSASFNTTTGEITPGSIIALTDKRDDEVYTIAKLADDKCWMIENLRLEHEGTVGNNKNDTSVTNQSLSQGYGGTTGTYGNFVGLANPESAYFSSSSTNSIYKSSANPPVDTYDPANNTLEDIGISNYPAYRFPRYNNSNISSALQSPTFTENYANAASPSTSGTYKTSTISSYGNYYTWAAAMANTNYYTSSSTSEAAGTSICPSNWTLPTSGTDTKEYGTLSQRYGGTGFNQSGTGTGGIMSNRFRSFPNNFLYSGYFNGSSANSRGSGGGYRSRSAVGYSGSYGLYLSSTNLLPSDNNGNNSGFSVRCLIGS